MADLNSSLLSLVAGVDPILNKTLQVVGSIRWQNVYKLVFVTPKSFRGS